MSIRDNCLNWLEILKCEDNCCLSIPFPVSIVHIWAISTSGSFTSKVLKCLLPKHTFPLLFSEIVPSLVVFRTFWLILITLFYWLWKTGKVAILWTISEKWRRMGSTPGWRRNKPFPSCCLSRFRSESWCSTIEREMSSICIRMRKIFPFEWLCTRTRFETELCSNSEMGYLICIKIVLWNQRCKLIRDVNPLSNPFPFIARLLINVWPVFPSFKANNKWNFNLKVAKNNKMDDFGRFRRINKVKKCVEVVGTKKLHHSIVMLFYSVLVSLLFSKHKLLLNSTLPCHFEFIAI